MDISFSCAHAKVMDICWNITLMKKKLTWEWMIKLFQNNYNWQQGYFPHFNFIWKWGEQPINHTVINKKVSIFLPFLIFLHDDTTA